MIDEYGEYLFYDFAYTKYDLGDVLRPDSGLTPRGALCIIKHLPIDSAFKVALQGGDQFRGWDEQMYMSANLLDAVNLLTHTFVTVNSPKKPKPFEPTQRPATTAEKPKARPGSAMFAAMARVAYKKG